MLQAMLKQCSSTASSMQKAYRVRVVRRTYGEHERIVRGRRRNLWPVTGPMLDSEVYRWPGPRGSAGLPWRPTKRRRDAQIYSFIIPSRPTI
jgi:hypothetical protein